MRARDVPKSWWGCLCQFYMTLNCIAIGFIEMLESFSAKTDGLVTVETFGVRTCLDVSFGKEWFLLWGNEADRSRHECLNSSVNSVLSCDVSHFLQTSLLFFVLTSDLLLHYLRCHRSDFCMSQNGKNYNSLFSFLYFFLEWLKYILVISFSPYWNSIFRRLLK